MSGVKERCWVRVTWGVDDFKIVSQELRIVELDLESGYDSVHRQIYEMFDNRSDSRIVEYQYWRKTIL